MSDKPIAVGDLVMVVRGPRCCGTTSFLGATFRVVSIWMPLGKDTCKHCGAHREGELSAKGHPEHPFFVHRLKKIDPPADAISEDARVRKPVKEPENA